MSDVLQEIMTIGARQCREFGRCITKKIVITPRAWARLMREIHTHQGEAHPGDWVVINTYGGPITVSRGDDE